MIQDIWEKINSLSEDAQAAGESKAKELNFDINKGGISLTESFINLNLARAMLGDAIKKGKLIQLPITLQRQLNDQLSNIARLLTSLNTGSDEIVNLTAAIETLKVASKVLWIVEEDAAKVLASLGVGDPQRRPGQLLIPAHEIGMSNKIFQVSGPSWWVVNLPRE